MSSQPLFACGMAFLFLCAMPTRVYCRASRPNEENRASASQASKAGAPKQGAPAKQSSPEEELQQAINDAGNDRVALVRNLEAFLKKYPGSRQRPQIYRALVEANLQLRDKARAADYAERLVALNPDDISITILTIQLLEQNGGEAGLRRAANYATRVLEVLPKKNRQRFHRKNG